MFELDRKKMVKDQMLDTLEKIVQTFGASLNYYRPSRKSQKGFELIAKRPKSQMHKTKGHTFNESLSASQHVS